MNVPMRKLGTTGVSTSAIGLGCAGLFRLPWRRERMTVLAAAFDSGIRHFDTAPMYGLGLAEAELGAFIKRRRSEITVTTKFGINPTALTKALAPLQGPARSVLARRPNLNDGLKKAGENADSGLIGHLLYRSPMLEVRAAQQSLDASLRALGTDYIDVFLLHDPIGARMVNPPELADYLNQQCKSGRIRCWGVTGIPDNVLTVRESLGWPAVIQHREDAFDEEDRLGTAYDARITYGALARTTRAFSRYFTKMSDAAASWGERLDIDVEDGAALGKLLLSTALARNPAGPVLFSTTKPERVALAAAAALAPPSADVVETLRKLAATVRATAHEWGE